jgi:hypothetical protein
MCEVHCGHTPCLAKCTLVCVLQEGLPPGVVVGEYIGQTNIKNADYSEAWCELSDYSIV